MRLFLAINLPDALRERVWRECAPLRDAAPSVAWVRAELLHFTLKFIGATTLDAMRQVSALVGPIVTRVPSTVLALSGAGAFPNERRPRVVWIGVQPNPVISGLAGAMQQPLTTLGIPADERPYVPHLTIGRIKRELGRGEGVALQQAMRQLAVAGRFDVVAVDLMESTLGRGGPTYTLVERFPLAVVDAGRTAEPRGVGTL